MSKEKCTRLHGLGFLVVSNRNPVQEKWRESMHWKGWRAEVGWAGGGRGLARGASWWCIVISQSVQSLSRARFFRPPGLQHTRPPCPKPTPGAYSNSWPSSPVMPSNPLILCRPLLLPPSIFFNIRVFSNESVLCIRWPKYWSFSFISPFNEHSRLISFRMDWLDLLAVQRLSRVFS